MGETTWTTDKPSEPGWYWRRGTEYDSPLPVRIVRRGQGTILFALVRGNEPPQNWTHKLEHIGGEWWPLPIQPPAQSEVAPCPPAPPIKP